MPSVGSWMCRAALGLCLLAPLELRAQDYDVPVDLELVLAVDVSGSIDEVEARLQREGYVAAFRHPEVVDAIQSGMFGRIAVTYFEWANDEYKRLVADWTLLEDAPGILGFADALAEAPLSRGRWTSISGAIDYGTTLFDGNGFDGFRQVIDVSGDGYNNRGRSAEQARDEAVAAGITVNGLPVVNERPNPWGSPPAFDLDVYYETRVIGGPGAFIVVAEDFTAFASAILSKLLLEIAGLEAPVPLAPDEPGISIRYAALN